MLVITVLTGIASILTLLGLILLKDLSTTVFWVLFSSFILFLIIFVYGVSRKISDKCMTTTKVEPYTYPLEPSDAEHGPDLEKVVRG